MEDNVLIYDIETKTFGRPDADRDIMRLFGCYSYKKQKPFLLTKLEDVQRVVNGHKFFVGFNNEKYDNPILERHKIDLKYKIIIDLMKIITMRAGSIKIKEGYLKDVLMEYNLDYITRKLKLVDDSTAKGELDYDILKRDVWTKEEREQLKLYTIRDIEITKKLYEWLEDYFAPFKDFLLPKDVEKKVYLTASIAKFTYKAICKAMNWKEEYGSVDYSEGIKGGYVAYPAGERFEGNIYCLDYNSLYPHIMIQCNLFSRKHDGVLDDRDTWIGDNVWKVIGNYYSDELSDVSKLLKGWYYDRTEFKKVGNRKEYTIKIMLNTAYGILNTAYYTRVFDKIAGGDCTRIGRQWTKYARKVFKEEGYQLLYTDTDSVYILDPFNDKERMLKVKNKIIDFIKSTVPFPQDTFDMGIDDEITHMFFFKGGSKKDDVNEDPDEDDFINKGKGFMKKNYCYIKKILDKEGNDTGKRALVLKNLGVRKKSNSLVSRKLFWDIMVPKIIETGECKFKRTFVENEIQKLLEQDIKLASLRKNVGPVSDYKKSPTGLQAQISQKYGPGIHFLIPNTKGIGVGKGKSYCKIEEFKKHKMNINHIDLRNVWKELEYFIKPVKVKTLADFGLGGN